MNLNLFMERGISGLMRTAARFYLSGGKGRAFLSEILPEIHRSAKIRERHEQAGTHVPPFLIASITSQCNLRCSGCYARANGGCGDSAATGDLSAAEWEAIFTEASGLGVSFILLAGGEPLTRPDVIHIASGFSNIVFPVFTNGTMMTEETVSLFDDCRNLIPVISLEGDADSTDRRRGGGVYALSEAAMEGLKKKNILFGASVTVTRENMRAVTSDAFVSELRDKGCGLVFFVEYVPAAGGTDELVLRSQDMYDLKENTASLKKRFSDMIIISFPGDEEAMGGCLASGRGFFHINSRGGAEPCPFSPFSARSLKTSSIAEVLHSSFFCELRELAANTEHQQGGCSLFGCEEQVQSLMTACVK